MSKAWIYPPCVAITVCFCVLVSQLFNGKRVSGNSGEDIKASAVMIESEPDREPASGPKSEVKSGVGVIHHFKVKKRTIHIAFNGNSFELASIASAHIARSKKEYI